MAQDRQAAGTDVVTASWPAPGERPLDLVRRFLNTVRMEEGVDLLADPAQASAWLASQGFDDLVIPASGLRRYRDLRDVARLAMRGDGAALRALNDMLPKLAEASPVVDRSSSGWNGGLRAHRTPLERRPLQSIALSLWRGAVNGELARLKICADERCQLAFYDRSRNQSRVWCTAGECGNRNRVARHRARATATIDG